MTVSYGSSRPEACDATEASHTRSSCSFIKIQKIKSSKNGLYKAIWIERELTYFKKEESGLCFMLLLLYQVSFTSLMCSNSRSLSRLCRSLLHLSRSLAVLLYIAPTERQIAVPRYGINRRSLFTSPYWVSFFLNGVVRLKM